jgi:hypothetical protein
VLAVLVRLGAARVRAVLAVLVRAGAGVLVGAVAVALAGFAVSAGGPHPAARPALALSVVVTHGDPGPEPSGGDDASAGRLALLAEARRALATMRDSSYQHQTEVDAAEGAYNFDCSGFVDYALGRARPAALAALPVSSSKRRPLAKDFEHHLRAITDGANGTDGRWRAVRTVPELRPGAVIAWLRPADVHSRNTGHVVIVLRKPVPNPARADEWLVEVADSTESPHAADSRDTDGDGLGTGTIGLSVDGAGRPVGYYWRGGVSTVLQHTEISLGEPV